MRIKLIPFLLASVFILQPAFAETAAAPSEPAPVVHSPIMPVKIKPRQGGADAISKAAADIEQENTLNPDSLGLYSRVSDGGLGNDLWKGYTSAKLAEDLASLPTNISSPTFRTLFLRALLTAPDTDSFAEDKVKSEAFSARVTSLIDMGAFEETVTLYKKLEGNIPSPSAALAGVQGIASAGQMGLACLEEKALSDDLKTTESTSFWPDLKSFCTILLTTDTSDTQDDKYSFTKASTAFATAKTLHAPATLAELNGKSVIEILAMHKAGLITKSLFTPENTKALKPEVIALLLKQSPDSQGEKLSLLSAASEKGIVPNSAFITEFVTQASLPASVPAASSWQPALSLYAKTQAATSEDLKTTSLKEALGTFKSSANPALLAFAGLFGSIKNAESFTPEEARKVVALLIRSKVNVSGAWYAQAFAKPDAKARESITDLDVVSALLGGDVSGKSIPSDDSTKNSEKTEKEDKTKAEGPERIEKSQLHVISLILENQEAEDKAAEKSYEKVFSLTGQTDYVMPSKELMNKLTESTSKQDTGKVILYSLQILNGQRVSQIHPAALYRISEGLRSVGLSEENRSLAHEVLADLIEY